MLSTTALEQGTTFQPMKVDDELLLPREACKKTIFLPPKCFFSLSLFLPSHVFTHSAFKGQFNPKLLEEITH